jgi:hypothetical protein
LAFSRMSTSNDTAVALISQRISTWGNLAVAEAPADERRHPHCSTESSHASTLLTGARS